MILVTIALTLHKLCVVHYNFCWCLHSQFKNDSYKTGPVEMMWVVWKEVIFFKFKSLSIWCRPTCIFGGEFHYLYENLQTVEAGYNPGQLIFSPGRMKVIYGLIRVSEFSSLEEDKFYKRTKNPHKLVIAAC